MTVPLPPDRLRALLRQRSDATRRRGTPTARERRLSDFAAARQALAAQPQRTVGFASDVQKPQYREDGVTQNAPTEYQPPDLQLRSGGYLERSVEDLGALADGLAYGTGTILSHLGKGELKAAGKEVGLQTLFAAPMLIGTVGKAAGRSLREIAVADGATEAAANVARAEEVAKLAKLARSGRRASQAGNVVAPVLGAEDPVLAGVRQGLERATQRAARPLSELASGAPPAGAEPAFLGPLAKGAKRPVAPATLSELAAGPVRSNESLMPVEMIPGSKWRVPGAKDLAAATPRTRALYTQEQVVGAGDLLDEADTHFGLSGASSLRELAAPGVGSYEGRGNTNMIVQLPALVQRDGTAVAPSALEKDALARGMAVLGRQNAVPWMTPQEVPADLTMRLSQLPAHEAARAAEAAGAPSTGFVAIPLARAVRPGEAEALAQQLADRGLPHNFTIVNQKDGPVAIFGNFSQFGEAPVSDAQVAVDVTEALAGHPVWESVTPDAITPLFGRAHSNYLGDVNEAGHLAELQRIAAGREADPAAAALAERLLAFLGRNTARIRGGQEAVDRGFRSGVALDRSIGRELRAAGVTPKVGLDAPYDARGLHPSLLQRGSRSIPLLDAEGRPNKGAVPASTSEVNVERSLAAIDAAFAKTPNPLASEKSYTRWASELFGPVVPKRPTLSENVARDPAPTLSMLARLDNPETLGPARMRAPMGSDSDSGMQLAASFGDAYKAGTATPTTSLMLYSWGSLSKRASVAPHETAFLDLMFSERGETLEPILDRVARGVYTAADKARIREIAASLPEGAFSRQVTSNINALSDALEKMARPARNARAVTDVATGQTRLETNAERWHQLLTDRTMSDADYLKEFQRSFAGQNIGMDNKVVSFSGLVAGRKNLLVPDRVHTALQWDAAKAFKGTPLASNIYENGGISGLMMGAQGLAMQEAMHRGLAPQLKTLYRKLHRPEDAALGRFHWESWVSASDQEVGHGSLDLIRDHATGKDVRRGTTLVKEGQLDKFRYGEFQGVLNGERVFGFTRSDGQMFVVPRERYLELSSAFKKLAPKKFKISENTRAPYWTAEGYPAEARDRMITEAGIAVPPPPAETPQMTRKTLSSFASKSASER